MNNFQLNYTGNQINAWGERLDTLEEQVGDLIDRIYPVGAIYISVNSTDPSILFGGTWEQIEGRFLLASNSTYTAGSVGGEAMHTLTTNEMPSHHHALGQDWADWKLQTGGGGPRGIYVGYAYSTNSKDTGGDGAHNNLQPYITVYMWKRTA